MFSGLFENVATLEQGYIQLDIVVTVVPCRLILIATSVIDTAVFLDRIVSYSAK